MKLKFVMGFLLLLIPGLVVAKNAYRAGKIVSMNSVPCAKSPKALCHEYVIHSEGMEYRVLDQKNSQVLLQVGQHVTFQMQKDRMKVRALDAEGKNRQRELRVVQMKAIGKS